MVVWAVAKVKNRNLLKTQDKAQKAHQYRYIEDYFVESLMLAKI